jgi:hypothetical protein
MPNPLKMRTHANGIYNNGVQVTTNAELDFLSKKLLTLYATESGAGDNTGDLNIDSLGTSVGIFEDNFATSEIGTHPYTGSTSTTTYTFKQNTSSASESSIHPLITHDGTSNPGHIRVVSDAELNAVMDLALADIAKANSTAAGTGTYYISESAPSIAGTWVAQDNFYDEITNHANDDSSKTTYKLWRKTSYDNSPSDIKLLKQVNGTLKVQSDSELENLTSRLRNRIIATGIGTYKFQASAPGTGTWVARGTATDRNPVISSIQYTGTYSDNYSRQFARQFGRQFSAQYTRGQFDRQFANQFTRIYTGQYARQFTRSFFRSFARAIIGSQFSRGQYTRIYSAQYTGQYTRIYSAQYTRQFARIYSAQYGRPYTTQFTRQFDGSAYTKTFSGTYSRGSQFTRQFQRNYTADYSRSFIRSQYTRIYSANYGRTFSAQYGRIFSAQYGRTFARVGINVTYDRSYTGTYVRTYDTLYLQQFARSQETFSYNSDWMPTGYGRSYTRNENPYYGPPTVLKPADPDQGGTYYRGDIYTRSPNVYVDPGLPPLPDGSYKGFSRLEGYYRELNDFQGNQIIFSNSYVRATRPGPTYTGYSSGTGYSVTYYGQYTSQYDRTTPGPQYARLVTGPSYSRTTPGPQYTRATYTVNFARLTTGPQYNGPQYTSTYDGNRSYGTYVRQFDGPQYTGEFIRANYSRSTPGPQYNGPQYSRTTPGPQYTRGQFSRATTGPQYTGQFTALYSADYSVGFSRGTQYAVQFTRIVTGPQYTGQFTRAQFTGQYTRSTSGASYSDGQYTSNYAGSRERQYTGDTVTGSFTTTTKTLWLRVA